MSSAAVANLRLDAACTLREAPDLHFALLGAVVSPDSQVIDAGGVERVDTAGLQLLVAFVRQRAATAQPVEWSAVSPELLRAAQRLGLLDELRIPATLRAAGG